MKPILLIYGNCQAQTLAGLVVGFTQVTEVFEVRHLNSFLPFASTGFHKDEFKRVRLLWEQVGLKQAMPFDELIQNDAEVIKYSELSFMPLWPFNIPNPHNRPTAQFPNGPYPYGDRVALQLAQEGVQGSEVLPAYISRGHALMPNLDRLFTVEIARMEKKAGHVDVDLSSEILQSWRDKRLFATYNHPSNELLVTLLGKLVKASAGLAETISDDLWDNLYQHVVLEQKGPDCEVLQMPIHPALKDVFNLQWYTDLLGYRHLQRGVFKMEGFLQDYVDHLAGREWAATR